MSDERFEQVKQHITDLCNCYGLPVPQIQRARETDKCDYTSTKQIRIYLDNDISYYEHGRHLFIHYLCNLEQDPDIGDHVVNLIEYKFELPG